MLGLPLQHHCRLNHDPSQGIHPAVGEPTKIPAALIDEAAAAGCGCRPVGTAAAEPACKDPLLRREVRYGTSNKVASAGLELAEGSAKAGGIAIEALLAPAIPPPAVNAIVRKSGGERVLPNKQYFP